MTCKTWAGLIGLGSILGWAQFWAGLDFGLGSIDYRVIWGQRLVNKSVTSVPDVIKPDACSI